MCLHFDMYALGLCRMPVCNLSACDAQAGAEGMPEAPRPGYNTCWRPLRALRLSVLSIACSRRDLPRQLLLQSSVPGVVRFALRGGILGLGSA